MSEANVPAEVPNPAEQDSNASGAAPADTSTPAPSDANVDTPADVAAKVADGKDDKQAEPNPSEKVTPAETKPSADDLELALPKDSLISAAELDTVKAYAKANGLSKEVAQKILEEKNSSVSAYAASQKAAYDERASKWRSEIEKDPEIGGKDFQKNVELAGRVLNRFATPALIKVLNESRLGDHPDLVKTFARIAKATSADTLVLPGSQAQGPKKSAQDWLYGGGENKQN